MSTAEPRSVLALRYYNAAQEYLRRLPLEHFMEAIAQSKQREITLESLALVTARRPEVQVFNELLVQYPLPRRKRPGQIVPDNMVVICPEPIKADGSYDTPLQPVGPFWVLEYVSKHNRRKDYEGSFEKYERELKVPYYLLFYPDNQELTLYHLEGAKYVSVKPNTEGRLAIPELDLEMALVGRWVRYWYKGELLPLPGDLQRELDEARHALEAERGRAEAERQARLAAERELEQLRARLRDLQPPAGEGP